MKNRGRIQELSKRSYQTAQVDRSTVARSVKLESKGLGFSAERAAKGNKKNRMVCDGKGEKLYPFPSLAENNYSEETSLQGFSQAEVKALENAEYECVKIS